MTPDAKPADVPIDVSEDDVDAALAPCGGDARAEASWGYIRAQPSRWMRDAS